jgi:hypothetical protein
MFCIFFVDYTWKTYSVVNADQSDIKNDLGIPN